MSWHFGGGSPPPLRREGEPQRTGKVVYSESCSSGSPPALHTAHEDHRAALPLCLAGEVSRLASSGAWL
jgi:hypothetical protein